MKSTNLFYFTCFCMSLLDRSSLPLILFKRLLLFFKRRITLTLNCWLTLGFCYFHLCHCCFSLWEWNVLLVSGEKCLMWVIWISEWTVCGRAVIGNVCAGANMHVVDWATVYVYVGIVCAGANVYVVVWATVCVCCCLSYCLCVYWWCLCWC